MPGPAPKPTVLKKLAGNPGKRPLNDSEPKPRAVRLHAPGWLSADAKVEWRRITPELYRLGLLTVVDRAALAAYCQAWGDAVDAKRHLDVEGKMLETDKGYRYFNPWWSVYTKSLDVMDKFGAKFGYSPSDRTRIRLESNEKQLSLAEILFTGVDGE